MLQYLLSQLSGKSNNNMLLYTSVFKCMLNVLYVGRDKDTKVRKLASSAFTKKATSKGSSAKLHKNSVLKYGHKSHILELWDLFRVIALLHQK